MGGCELPATGASLIGVVVVGVLAVLAGVLVVRWGRGRPAALVVALLVGGLAIVTVDQAEAAPDCPPPATGVGGAGGAGTSTTVPETTVPATTVPETTVPETTVPATTVPETTEPETTVPETTVPETTEPETTEPRRPPVASPDWDYAGRDSSFSMDLFVNDDLGNPPATVAWTPSNGDCSWLSVDSVTGIASGTPPSTFVTCEFAYTLTNSEGTSSTKAGITALLPPVAGPDLEFAPIFLPFTFNVFTNDDLGNPPATGTWTPTGGDCSWLSFDGVSGVVSGTPVLPGICEFTYTLTNLAGTSSAPVTIFS